MTFIKHTKPEKSCKDPEHNSPTHIVLPAGTHTWQCPSCGDEQTIEVPEITM